MALSCFISPPKRIYCYLVVINGLGLGTPLKPNTGEPKDKENWIGNLG